MTVPLSTRPSLGRRLASLFYECLLAGAVLLVGLFVPLFILAAGAHFAPGRNTVQAAAFLILLLYFVWFWLHGGQTLAMKTWRLRLVQGNGQPVQPIQALLRYLLCWPSLLCLGLGLWWAWIDKEGLFLHDRLAGTRLQLEPPAEKKGR